MFNSPRAKFGVYTATCVVISNMIGTGVFTSLGFQAVDIKSVFALLLLWIIGGIMALCGALCYGEIGAALPRSGGEYHYLSKLFHPRLGFLAGWVSGTVGFAAPVALAAMALGSYSSRVLPSLNPTLVAISVVIVLSLIHSASVSTSGAFQNVFTSVKVAFIAVFVVAGILAGNHQTISILPAAADLKYIAHSAFPISLYFVSYSYSGWNGSAYIAGEIERPQRNLPLSLLLGTAIVTLLYLLLNFVFLYTAPISELAGKLEVGFVSANRIFGLAGAKIVAGIICFALFSTTSAMIIAGPRVIQVIGEDLPLLKALGSRTKRGIPLRAIAFQSTISLILILTSTFEKVLVYVGFTLNLFTFLTVAGLFVLRAKHPDWARPYKAWGYPFTPIVFLMATGWLLVYGFLFRPAESLGGLATVLLGLILYQVGRRGQCELVVEPGPVGD